VEEIMKILTFFSPYAVSRKFFTWWNVSEKYCNKRVISYCFCFLLLVKGFKSVYKKVII